MSPGKHWIAWPSTNSFCASGRRPSTWWRRARWTPSGTAISPIPPSSCPWPPEAATWVDLGSGAGFPGLWWSRAACLPRGRRRMRPLPPCGEGTGVGEIARTFEPSDPTPRPHALSHEGERGSHATPRVTLIESNARKCAFLREVVRQTGIAARVTVDILSTRIEAAATQARLRGPDVVSARALAPLDRLLGPCGPLILAAHGWVILEGPRCRHRAESCRKDVGFQRRAGSEPHRSRRPRRRDPQSPAQGQSEGMIP